MPADVLAAALLFPSVSAGARRADSHSWRRSDVPIGSRKAGDEPASNRIANLRDHNGNRDSCSLSGTGWRRTSRDNDVYQLGRQRRQAIECFLRVSLLDDDVLTFQISQLSQPLLKSSQRALLNFQLNHRKKTYPRDLLRLLRLGGTAKRKEHGTNRKSKDVSIHCCLLTPYASPLMPRDYFHLMT